MYMTFLPPRKPTQFCNSLVACYWESKSTNDMVDFWEARVREQAWECRAQSLSHSCCPVSCLHLTQQHTWESHTPQTQVFTEENPKQWEMHYRADCVTRVSLILFCTVWFPEASCRLPSLWVWFPLPMGLCWPRCKSLGSAVSLSHPTQEQTLHTLASEMLFLSFKAQETAATAPYSITRTFHKQYYLLPWEINTNETWSTMNPLWLLHFPIVIMGTSTKPLGMTHRPDGLLWDCSCSPGLGSHALGSLWKADATCTSAKPITVLAKATNRGWVKGSSYK